MLHLQRWGASKKLTSEKDCGSDGGVFQVDGVPIEVLKVFLFFKQKLLVVMIDMSIACPVSKSLADLYPQATV